MILHLQGSENILFIYPRGIKTAGILNSLVKCSQFYLYSPELQMTYQPQTVLPSAQNTTPAVPGLRMRKNPKETQQEPKKRTFLKSHKILKGPSLIQGIF